MAPQKCTYQPPAGRHLSQIGIAALLAGSMIVGAGVVAPAAHADPQQPGLNQGAPSQPGLNPGPQQDQQQPGLTPSQPAPAPAPVAPSYNPGPMGAPSAPYAPPSEHVSPDYSPTYPNSYSPVPTAPIHAPNGNAPKVKRIAPKVDTLRVGNFERDIKDLPDFPNKVKTVDWANGWASYSEQEIANFLISIGIPEDEASRQAAATVMAAAAGGAIGGAIGFTTTTIIVGTVAVPIGATIGGLVGSTMGNPVSILGGAGLGAAGGLAVAVGAGAVVGTGTAIIGAVIGGALGYALGTGDPGGKAKKPHDSLPQREMPGKHRKAEPLPNPAGNQFELHLNKSDAKQAGLPAVDYVVTQRGDVNVTVGNTQVGWTAEQGQAPIKALGPAAPAVTKVINDVTRDVTDQAAKAINGLQVSWPQLEKPAKSSATAGKHGR